MEEDRLKENQSKGFIVLFRSLLDWEYIDDDTVFSCFVKILLAVNYQDKKWHGQEIKRGSMIGSTETLCGKLHMKKDSLRRCLKLLSECKAINIEVIPNKYHIITVPNYDLYQDRVIGKTDNKTHNRTDNKTHNRTDNKTHNRADNKTDTTKQYNKINKGNKGVGVCAVGTHTPTPTEKEKEAALTTVSPPVGAAVEPLTVKEWRTYCELKGQDDYKADEVWRKCNGHFSEKSILQVRECLKNG